MIVYDKYRLYGGFHWSLMKTDKRYRQRIDTVAIFVKPSDIVLDLGSGDGAGMGVIAKKCVRVDGVDIEKVGCAIAEDKFKKFGIENARVFNMKFSEAAKKLPADTYDIVYAMDVIEHLESPSELLRLARKCMKARGRTIIGTPLFRGKGNVSKYHVKEYTKAEILKLLGSHFSVSGQIFLPDRLNDRSISPDRFGVFICKRN